MGTSDLVSYDTFAPAAREDPADASLHRVGGATRRLACGDSIGAPRR
jgi:hypothetical protein